MQSKNKSLPILRLFVMLSVWHATCSSGTLNSNEALYSVETPIMMWKYRKHPCLCDLEGIPFEIAIKLINFFFAKRFFLEETSKLFAMRFSVFARESWKRKNNCYWIEQKWNIQFVAPLCTANDNYAKDSSLYLIFTCHQQIKVRFCGQKTKIPKL